MKLPRRTFLQLAAGAAALPAVSRITWAQAYPSRPVRVVVGCPPGTTPDILARLMSQWLSERLRQPFVVENKPGAASKIKFANNPLVTINTAAIGEAVALALKAGVEPEIMIKAISSGSGGSVLFPIGRRAWSRRTISRHRARSESYPIISATRRSRKNDAKRDAAVSPRGRSVQARHSSTVSHSTTWPPLSRSCTSYQREGRKRRKSNRLPDTA
jgi:hypothetical protein